MPEHLDLIEASDGMRLYSLLTHSRVAAARPTSDLWVIRLAEIDAPEKKQPFGERSRQALASLCFQREAVLRPTTTDRYGRTVARVECDCRDANAEQVRAGMAWAYTQYQADPAIPHLELQARRTRTGLWSDLGTAAEPMAPWEWRKARREIGSRPRPS